jgi:hypothetical protein
LARHRILGIVCDILRPEGRVSAVAVLTIIAWLTGLATSNPLLAEQNPSTQGASSAQPTIGGPSLQETLDWIKDKLKTSAQVSSCYDGSQETSLEATPDNCKRFQTTRIEPLDFSGCTVSWLETQVNYDRADNGNASTQVSKTTIHLPLYEEFTSYHSWLNRSFSVWFLIVQLVDQNSGKIHHQSTSETLSNDGTTRARKANGTVASSQYVRFGIPGTDNKEMAIRVSKALGRAIDLCQSQKPKNTEPF